MAAELPTAGLDVQPPTCAQCVGDATSCEFCGEGSQSGLGDRAPRVPRSGIEGDQIDVSTESCETGAQCLGLLWSIVHSRDERPLETDPPSGALDVVVAGLEEGVEVITAVDRDELVAQPVGGGMQ